MANLKGTRRILKALGEDTRLRIIALLRKNRLNVAQLCEILNSTQSNISKHLARLRLTGIVSDRREGQFIYYHLARPEDPFYEDLLDCIVNGLSESEIYKKDTERLKELEIKYKAKS